jgi:hypothetical protein
MSAKKKKTTLIQPAENIEESSVTEATKSEEFPGDQESMAELPVRQVEETEAEPKQEPAEADVKVEQPEESKQESVKVSDQTSALSEVVSTQETQPLPKPEKPKPLTMVYLAEEIRSLHEALDQQAQLISKLLETPVRQRKPPTSVERVQVRDKTTGKIYKSKNNLYQSLLKAGELKELVDQGLFGKDPQHNNFGTFSLLRAWPNRFEEIKSEAKDASAETP